MATALPDETRIRFEHTWANHTVERSPDISDADWRLWKDCSISSRTFIHPQRHYAVWRHTASGVKVVDTLQMASTGHQMTLEAGLSLNLTRRDGSSFAVGSTPRRLPDADVFLWLPGINDVRFAPWEYSDAAAPRLLRLAMNFKQRFNSRSQIVEEADYLSELADFYQLNPQHPKF